MNWGRAESLLMQTPEEILHVVSAKSSRVLDVLIE